MGGGGWELGWLRFHEDQGELPCDRAQSSLQGTHPQRANVGEV